MHSIVTHLSEVPLIAQVSEPIQQLVEGVTFKKKGTCYDNTFELYKSRIHGIISPLLTPEIPASPETVREYVIAIVDSPLSKRIRHCFRMALSHTFAIVLLVALTVLKNIKPLFFNTFLEKINFFHAHTIVNMIGTPTSYILIGLFSLFLVARVFCFIYYFHEHNKILEESKETAKTEYRDSTKIQYITKILDEIVSKFSTWTLFSLTVPHLAMEPILAELTGQEIPKGKSSKPHNN